MPTHPGLELFAAAALGLLVLAVQHLALRRHLRGRPAAPRRTPPVSILKPLCGVDDGLAGNLASFAALDYPEYEVLLGLRSADDPALAPAREAARRWPARFRIVLQRGEPGQNPKVNQLITLARAARHGVLVVSDSNVRVEAGYLSGIAALLEDEAVGLVTHPVAGVGEARLGSLFDALHLAGAIAPGVVAAKRLAGRDIVVGKSMALRRPDLEAMGGFEAVKDVLAEDYVMGVMVGQVLGKRVAVGHRPVQNVSERRSVRDFTSRYGRWSVLQRQAVGPLAYSAQALLNPVLLAAAGAALSRTPAALWLLAGTCAAKAAVDGASARVLRPAGFRAAQLALVPAKDLLVGAAWLWGLLRRDVAWRGTRLVVGRGTRIARSPQRHRPHRERGHVEPLDREAHPVAGDARARDVQERQVVVGGGVGEPALLGLGRAGQEVVVLALQRARDRLVERARPAGRLPLAAVPGGEGVAQVVDEVPAPQDEHPLVPERREGASEGEVPRRGEPGVEAELDHRHVGRGPQVHEHAPGPVVEPPLVARRSAPIAQQLRHASRQPGVARGGVRDAGKGVGEAIEVVDRLRPGGGGGAGVRPVPVRRDGEDGAGRGQRLAERAEGAAPAVVLDGVHRGAVAHEEDGHAGRWASVTAGRRVGHVRGSSLPGAGSEAARAEHGGQRRLQEVTAGCRRHRLRWR